jgi:hypothetical protein
MTGFQWWVNLPAKLKLTRSLRLTKFSFDDVFLSTIGTRTWTTVTGRWRLGSTRFVHRGAQLLYRSTQFRRGLPNGVDVVPC